VKFVEFVAFCFSEQVPAAAADPGMTTALPLLDDAHRHRLRRGALHLPARHSRQNAKLLLRRPLASVNDDWACFQLNHRKRMRWPEQS
jgi:hypothetical protein